MELFSTHLEPVWRDRANFIINAALEESGRFEQLWARQVSDNEFELCCIPFFLYDVSLGDIVRTSPRYGRQYTFETVVHPSGRRVFRLFFDRAPKTRRDAVVSRLTEHGSLLEWSGSNLLAVDVADPAGAQQVETYLRDRESAGWVIYERGWGDDSLVSERG